MTELEQSVFEVITDWESEWKKLTHEKEKLTHEKEELLQQFAIIKTKLEEETKQKQKHLKCVFELSQKILILNEELEQMKEKEKHPQEKEASSKKSTSKQVVQQDNVLIVEATQDNSCQHKALLDQNQAFQKQISDLKHQNMCLKAQFEDLARQLDYDDRNKHMGWIEYQIQEIINLLSKNSAEEVNIVDDQERLKAKLNQLTEIAENAHQSKIKKSKESAELNKKHIIMNGGKVVNNSINRLMKQGRNQEVDMELLQQEFQDYITYFSEQITIILTKGDTYLDEFGKDESEIKE